MDVWRQVLNKECQSRLNVGVVDDVKVVEHQINLLLRLAKLVHQARQHTVDRLLAGFEDREQSLGDVAVGLPQCDKHMGPKRVRLIVGLIERKPGYNVRRHANHQPLSEQGRLAKSGRR